MTCDLQGAALVAVRVGIVVEFDAEGGVATIYHALVAVRVGKS